MNNSRFKPELPKLTYNYVLVWAALTT
jgi:hypothetical protein